MRHDLDLEEGRPLLAGDEEAVMLGVVGDAVEDGFGGEALSVRKKAGAVDPGENAAVDGGDAGDTVGVPDIGVDEAVDELELVELVDGGWAVVDEDAASFGEGSRVAEAESSGAVRGDELAGGSGDAPAFAGVVEGADLAKSKPVVKEADVGLPGPLQEVGAVVDDAFAEVLRGKVDVLDGKYAAERVDEQAGVTFEAGAFVEESVLVEQAFGVAVGGVRVGVEDFVGVGGSLALEDGSEGEEDEGQTGKHASPV